MARSTAPQTGRIHLSRPSLPRQRFGLQSSGGPYNSHSRDGGYWVKPAAKPRNSTNNLPDFQSCSKVRKKLDTTMMLVVARQRCSEGGRSSRLMVKHSSSPSSKLAAAEGYFSSSH